MSKENINWQRLFCMFVACLGGYISLITAFYFSNTSQFIDAIGAGFLAFVFFVVNNSIYTFNDKKRKPHITTCKFNKHK